MALRLLVAGSWRFERKGYRFVITGELLEVSYWSWGVRHGTWPERRNSPPGYDRGAGIGRERILLSTINMLGSFPLSLGQSALPSLLGSGRSRWCYPIGRVMKTKLFAWPSARRARARVAINRRSNYFSSPLCEVPAFVFMAACWWM